jgi:hypothetical protein
MLTRHSLRKKLNDMADQLQVLEMQKGWHYMMGSQLNKEYEDLRNFYEILTGFTNLRR